MSGPTQEQLRKMAEAKIAKSREKIGTAYLSVKKRYTKAPKNI